jgi:CHAT domain-containing protein
VVVIDPGTAPAAARELDAIAGTLGRSGVTALRGLSATRSRTIGAMRNAGVVHFIAHAEANEHDPGSSRIDLSPDDGDDGRLDASQVAALRLDAPLVVLSACETANGRVLDGEGVLSLSRSFLRAGARATVATLWPVGTSAADFATAFYESIAGTRDAAEALRDAKLALRAAGAPPAAWAPYQLFAGQGHRPTTLAALTRE